MYVCVYVCMCVRSSLIYYTKYGYLSPSPSPGDTGMYYMIYSDLLNCVISYYVILYYVMLYVIIYYITCYL